MLTKMKAPSSPVDSGPPSHGYTYESVESVPHDYECSICQLILCHPVQIAKCGHRFCKNCLDPVLSEETPLCPLDREEIEVDKVFTDQACHRAIQGLLVKCPHSGKGCEWTGEIRDVQNHMRKCLLQPIVCVNGCDCELIPRVEMSDHITNECPLAVVECPYSDMGCTNKVQRIELPVHLQAQTQSHLDMTILNLTEVKMSNTALETKLEDYRVSLNGMEKRIDELERAPSKHDGKDLWRIKEYSRKLREAKNGERLYLYSDPFYTGRYGYKLRMCAALNGDGEATDKYMTLYITIMRGKFDALLPWPFKQKIRFSLMHQLSDYNKRQNIVTVVTPDVSLEGYSRPVEERNQGVGIWRFASHEVIANKGYLVDDVIYIKCEVEPFDILSQDT